ncbi:uncharacterized protein N7484_009367 [Penicillium longicatenatum]|uniref:uncharacterized protein n=1 Tax=Penicillium longicatenatum TaxID=1561947 RepID=UPI0025483097|nr:uncharacterized protein N7484_009367 [Penicillium longicatenatum]KAJ5636054.1 hypothetical protein N7484_009367 [Penicillium longicatenatum]
MPDYGAVATVLDWYRDGISLVHVNWTEAPSTKHPMQVLGIKILSPHNACIRMMRYYHRMKDQNTTELSGNN